MPLADIIGREVRGPDGALLGRIVAVRFRPVGAVPSTLPLHQTVCGLEAMVVVGRAGMAREHVTLEAVRLEWEGPDGAILLPAAVKEGSAAREA